jgi:hypothetical protein
MKFALAWLMFGFAASGAHASIYTICGENINMEKMTADNYVLEVSSQDDDFNGVSGGTWSLKLEPGEKGGWIENNPNITAKSKRVKGQTNVEISVVIGRSPTGPVGSTYVIKNIYGENPTLEKYTMGGFAGRILEKAVKCESAVD